ncbi:TerD family protein [Mycolicibacterium arenosum]|uniref:Tellurium resistance n=1 Tax=Mycolicibacterium arenosum TaxID=2952157 RepID=A0ABT1M4S5_9MYCO|nr:Tellurium resistance [Mycolicibacterium sp. CAU 1645]MCP9274116.1 Tellurium resistance [Mycolicibacterium sp. CAU 1645]
MAIDYTKRPSASTPPQAPPVNLSKISLTKDAPRISLSKDGAQQGVMRVNLNWSANAQGVDLDLGCLYELSDGSKSVIQALGNRYGSENSPPFILLDGDDRSGSNTGGENMRINLAQPERFRRILIFAMIYSGAANWAAVDGVVTMYPTVGAPIEVRLDSAVEGARICAIAQVYYAEGGVHVSREVRYINGSQRDLDAAYGWGMQWTTGSKD